MSNPKIAVYVELLEKARQQTLRTAAEVPEARRLAQLAPGKATPLWLVGHLANTINTVTLRWMLESPSVFTREQSVLFAPDFAGGTPPSTDAAIYPAWDELTALYERAMGDAIGGVAKLDDHVLPDPLPGKMPDPLRSFFPSIGAALGMMVNHDAYHRGQIALIGKL